MEAPCSCEGVTGDCMGSFSSSDGTLNMAVDYM